MGFPSKRRVAVLVAVLMASRAMSASAQTCPVLEGAQDIALRPDYSRMGKPFEGWGTALAWFANVTGGYPDPVRNRLADLLYGEQGLRWNIARYNIGGGNAPETKPYLRKGADLPGFWRMPASAGGSMPFAIVLTIKRLFWRRFPIRRPIL